VTQIIKVIAEYAAFLAEGLAAIVIVFGALQAMWTYLRRLIAPNPDIRQSCLCRIQLGHSLSLALEFLIGADILKTAVAPSWEDIGQLAAIIGIRTVLNFFLMWELGRTEKELSK